MKQVEIRRYRLLFCLLSLLTVLSTNNALRTQKFRLTTVHNLSGKPDDFIDAEIVESENFGSRTPSSSANEKPLSRRNDDGKEKGKEKGLFSGLAKLFGQDKKSKEKRKQKAELDKVIDRAFEGSGLVGGVLSGVAKSVGGMFVEAMGESQGQIQMVQRAVEGRLIQNDCRQTVSQLLGKRIVCGPPFSSSLSSTSVNGCASTSVSLVMPIQGDISIAQARVLAVIEGEDEPTIRELVLFTADGRSLSIEGGSGRGRSSGNSPGGRVIDADVL